MKAKKQARRAPRRKKKTTTGNPRRVPAVRDGFTSSEVTAAEHLVDLSQSPGCDGNGNGNGNGDGSGRGCGELVHAPTLPSSSFSASSTPRSVSPRAPAVATVEEADEENKEEGGMGRAPQKYRLITDLYAAATPIVVEYPRFVRISLEDRRLLKKRSSGGK